MPKKEERTEEKAQEKKDGEDKEKETSKPKTIEIKEIKQPRPSQKPEEIIDDHFTESLEPVTESTVPVLEQIAEIPQQVTRFIPGIGKEEDEEKERPTRYSINSGRDKSTEQKYEETPAQQTNWIPFTAQPTRIEIETASVDLRPSLREIDPINFGFQRPKRGNDDYMPKPGERADPFRQTESDAEQFESRMKKYEAK